MLRPTWDTGRPEEDFRLRGSHPLRPRFPAGSPSPLDTTARSRDPGVQAPRFGLLRFRSPLLAQCRLISSPAGTEMFHFPAYGPCGLCIRPQVAAYEGGGVAPFGNSRIKAR